MITSLFKFLKVDSGRPFKDEDVKFTLFTATKILLIGLIIFLFVLVNFYKLVELNNFYFISMGFPNSDTFKEAYYDYFTQNALQWVPIITIFLLAQFLGGLYIAKSLLRPFQNIGSFSKKAQERPNLGYVNHSFSSFHLLTSFSEFFFMYVSSCRKAKKLEPTIVPPQYSKIHKPVFDKIFFFHFCLILGVICIFSSIVLYSLSVELHSSMVTLAIKTLKISNQNQLMAYFSIQRDLLQSITWWGIFITIIFYIVFGFHLYGLVSGAAFGIFATMRSFMKGNHSARVHLIGYNYIRPQSRDLNKFLDHVVKEIDDVQKETG